jgi:hypothetical protein
MSPDFLPKKRRSGDDPVIENCGMNWDASGTEAARWTGADHADTNLI